jgi:hypothetical protein
MNLSFLTEKNFIFRFLLVSILTIIILFCIKNNNKGDKFSKPEWEPDNSVLMIIWPFIMILSLWCWYQSSINNRQNWFDLYYGATLLLITFLCMSFYTQNWETFSSILALVVLGISISQSCILFNFGLFDSSYLSIIVNVWLLLLAVLTFYVKLKPLVLGKVLPGAQQHPQREVMINEEFEASELD